MRRTGIVTAIALLLGPALLPVPAHAVQRLMDVRQVSSDTIRDVALVTVVKGRPTIYYNPVLLDRVGPELATFFITHEYGHIHHGHSGGALVHDAKLGELRVRQELDADCYAAEHLGESEPEVVNAALEFFLRMGPNRFDAYHPTGSQRAARILSCMPGHTTGMSSAPTFP
jgi:hypothetical protein